jgi:pimeloyl-ACP methyl ester carboxylesterase
LTVEIALESGIRLHYVSEGDGDPVVLLHGTGCDHRFWKLQREAYAERYQVVTVDMRGAGQSDVPPDPTTYTSEVMADDIAALVRSLELAPVHLAGHSLGSCVAQQVAIRHPDVVRSLQLHATWALADTWLQRAFIGTTRYPLERGDLHTTFRTVMMWMLSPDYLSSWGPEHVAEMVRHCFIENPHQQANQGMLGHLNADAVHDTRELLGSVSVPTLVTAGEQDYLIPARYGVAVAALVPGARLHVFEGPHSSHGTNWEMVDEFDAVTLEFMAGV